MSAASRSAPAIKLRYTRTLPAVSFLLRMPAESETMEAWGRRRSAESDRSGGQEEGATGELQEGGRGGVIGVRERWGDVGSCKRHEGDEWGGEGIGTGES